MNLFPITIDCCYLFPQFAASFLIHEENKGVFIENNTAHSIPILLDALKNEDISPKKVEYLIVTHVHLDHAGGTSTLLKACPNAKVICHPRAAPHIIDPTKLINSARAVYGHEEYEKLYGEIDPIHPDRVKVMQDGESIQLGTRSLSFFHTRGHANHHLCIFDSASEGVFTGDSFGIAYPALQTNGLFIFPSTSPTDFDPIEARKSIHKLIHLNPKRAYLTHFGEITDLKEAQTQLFRHLDFSEALLDKAIHSERSDSELVEFCENEIKIFFESLFNERNIVITPKIWNLIRLDVHLNAAGIAYVAKKRR